MARCNFGTRLNLETISDIDLLVVELSEKTIGPPFTKAEVVEIAIAFLKSGLERHGVKILDTGFWDTQASVYFVVNEDDNCIHFDTGTQSLTFAGEPPEGSRWKRLV